MDDALRSLKASDLRLLVEELYDGKDTYVARSLEDSVDLALHLVVSTKSIIRDDDCSTLECGNAFVISHI